jgi:hypothetical protein
MNSEIPQAPKVKQKIEDDLDVAPQEEGLEVKPESTEVSPEQSTEKRNTEILLKE